MVVEAPEKHRRNVLYLPRKAADGAMHWLACKFYDEACRVAASETTTSTAVDLALRSVAAGPSFPQPFLLAAHLRWLRRPEDDVFYNTMIKLAGDAAQASMAERNWFLPASAPSPGKLKRAAVSLFHLETTARLANVEALDSHTIGKQLVADLLLLPWPRALLDRGGRSWEVLAARCRRAKQYDLAQTASEMAFEIHELLLRARPDEPTNHLKHAAMLDGLGRLKEAAEQAVRAIAMPERPRPNDTSHGYLYRSGLANAFRIVGRARFLGQQEGSAAEPLREAKRRLEELLALGDPRSESYLKDRIAECVLYLAILEPNANKRVVLADEAVERYRELLSIRPTSSMHLLLCDALILGDQLTEARAELERYYALRRHLEPYRKREKIIARRARAKLGKDDLSPDQLGGELHRAAREDAAERREARSVAQEDVSEDPGLWGPTPDGSQFLPDAP